MSLYMLMYTQKGVKMVTKVIEISNLTLLLFCKSIFDLRVTFRQKS